MSLKHHPDCQEHVTGKCTCPVNREVKEDEFPPIIGWDEEKREEERFWEQHDKRYEEDECDEN